MVSGASSRPRNAFIEVDRRFEPSGPIHLVTDDMLDTICGRHCGPMWLSRPAGPFYGERRVKKGETLCVDCQEAVTSS